MVGRKGLKFRGFNSLWCFFYCLLVLGIQIYLWHCTFSRYGDLHSNHQQPTNGIINTAFTTRLVMNVISIILTPIYILACCIKIGNYANDGAKIGRDHTTKTDVVSSEQLHSRRSLLAVIWNHLPPIAPLMHVVISFLILFSKMFTDAAEIKSGYKSPESAWHSNTDFLFGNRRPEQSYFLATYRLSTVENATYFVLPTSRSSTDTSGKVSLEFLNYVIALVTLSVRYAATFWFTNKVLSVIFVSIMMVMCFNFMMCYSALEMVYKVAINADVNHKIDFKLELETLMTLDVIGGILVLSSTWLVFQHLINLFVNKYDIFSKLQNTSNPMQDNRLLDHSFAGYSIHIISMLVFVALSTLRAPVIWYYASVYHTTKDSLILTAVITSIVYLVLWCLVWIVFTVKRDWKFKVFGSLPFNDPNAFCKKPDVDKSDKIQLNANDNNTEVKGNTVDMDSKCDSSDGDVSVKNITSAQCYSVLSPLGEIGHYNTEATLSSSLSQSHTLNSIPCSNPNQFIVKPSHNRDAKDNTDSMNNEQGTQIVAQSSNPSNYKFPDFSTLQDSKDRLLTSQNSVSPTYSNNLSKIESCDNSLSRDSGIHESCSTPLRERHNSDDFVIANVVKLDTMNKPQSNYPITSLHLMGSCENFSDANDVGGCPTHPTQRLCSEV